MPQTLTRNLKKAIKVLRFFIVFHAQKLMSLELHSNCFNCSYDPASQMCLQDLSNDLIIQLINLLTQN